MATDYSRLLWLRGVRTAGILSYLQKLSVVDGECRDTELLLVLKNAKTSLTHQSQSQTFWGCGEQGFLTETGTSEVIAGKLLIKEPTDSTDNSSKAAELKAAELTELAHKHLTESQ